MNYYSDSEEWRYLFHHAIDWDTIVPLFKKNFPTEEGFNSKEELIQFYEELVTATGKWTAESVAPRARELDRVGGGKLVDGHVEITDVLKQTYDEAKALDVYGITIDPEYGGMGAPTTVGLIAFAQICRACVATGTQIGFFTSIADMIERFCDTETRARLVPMIQRGEISGSMCLTEPDAGSDVGALRTTATKQADGTYLLNGSKCFITNGGGGLGFVLARVDGAPKGLDGISMFLAEEWLDGKSNYRIEKIEEKLGMHGSPTCQVVYENTVAKLVGNENEGFKIMLHLMNEARISVGLQGLGGIEESLRHAREYAETRKQFGKPLIELPLFRHNLEELETERDGMRAMMIDTLSHYEVFQRLDSKKRHTGELTEEETKLHSKAWKLVRRRTPLVKYYGTEANATITQKAIQAFGGYGYMTEYDVERIHRDSIAGLLYEGTSQIQALMAMKDFIKAMMKNPAKMLQSLVAIPPLTGATEVEKSIRTEVYHFRKNVAGLVMRCFKPELSISENGFMETIAQIQKVFRKEYWQDTERFDKLMVHAETLCQALTYLETLKVLGRHATKDTARTELYNRYHRLVKPRLAGVYESWRG